MQSRAPPAEPPIDQPTHPTALGAPQLFSLPPDSSRTPLTLPASASRTPCSPAQSPLTAGCTSLSGGDGDGAGEGLGVAFPPSPVTHRDSVTASEIRFGKRESKAACQQVLPAENTPSESSQK